jgi:hypothetical protein
VNLPDELRFKRLHAALITQRQTLTGDLLAARTKLQRMQGQAARDPAMAGPAAQRVTVERIGALEQQLCEFDTRAAAKLDARFRVQS